MVTVVPSPELCLTPTLFSYIPFIIYNLHRISLAYYQSCALLIGKMMLSHYLPAESSRAKYSFMASPSLVTSRS